MSFWLDRWFTWDLGFRPSRLTLPEDYDGRSDRRDGEWHAIITLPHEIVEWEGRAVPAFEGDVERIEWERARGLQ